MGSCVAVKIGFWPRPGLSGPGPTEPTSTLEGTPGCLGGHTRVPWRAHQGALEGTPGCLGGHTRVPWRAHQGALEGTPGCLGGHTRVPGRAIRLQGGDEGGGVKLALFDSCILAYRG
ncbi:unnamed protein product [Gadus morhua 'NCC']